MKLESALLSQFIQRMNYSLEYYNIYEQLEIVFKE